MKRNYIAPALTEYPLKAITLLEGSLTDTDNGASGNTGGDGNTYDGNDWGARSYNLFEEDEI